MTQGLTAQCGFDSVLTGVGWLKFGYEKSGSTSS